MVHLTGAPDNRDGEWSRVRRHGFCTADVRSVAGLGQWFPLDRLEPDTLALAG